MAVVLVPPGLREHVAPLCDVHAEVPHTLVDHGGRATDYVMLRASGQPSFSARAAARVTKGQAAELELLMRTHGITPEAVQRQVRHILLGTGIATALVPELVPA